jgi:hypothetical protein
LLVEEHGAQRAVKVRRDVAVQVKFEESKFLRNQKITCKVPTVGTRPLSSAMGVDWIELVQRLKGFETRAVSGAMGEPLP